MKGEFEATSQYRNKNHSSGARKKSPYCESVHLTMATKTTKGGKGGKNRKAQIDILKRNRRTAVENLGALREKSQELYPGSNISIPAYNHYQRLSEAMRVKRGNKSARMDEGNRVPNSGWGLNPQRRRTNRGRDGKNQTTRGGATSRIKAVNEWPGEVGRKETKDTGEAVGR